MLKITKPKFFYLSPYSSKVRKLAFLSLIIFSSVASAQNHLDINSILNRTHICSPTLSLRSTALSKEQEQTACSELGSIEKRFHQVFAQNGRFIEPVKQDNNSSLRANIYRSKADYIKYASVHFNIPIDNGGMYLEGLPDQVDNHAEFIAYQKEQGQVHNLSHEYVHYLDGRFNLYGDFCANLNDSHSPPENCPLPSPSMPYLIWWTEGIAEYIFRGNDNAKALKAASKKSYALSELFNTGYESNNGEDRIYTWGYLATRFMMEKQRGKIDQMLTFTRSGDYPRYQALVRSWGASLDQEFLLWLDTLDSVQSTTGK